MNRSTGSPFWVRCMVVAGWSACAVGALSASSSAAASRSVAAHPGTDAITSHLIQPKELAATLALPGPRRPTLLQVGFHVLYRSGHIAGSRYVGPASKPEGLAALKSALARLRKDQPIVLYCGCCPWEHCPNVRPAYRQARALGYKNVQVLFINKDLDTDWIAKGYPMREGEQ